MNHRSPHVRVAALAVCAALAAIVASDRTNGVLAQTAGTCGFAQNPIECENRLAGNPSSQWDVSGSGSSSIQGFATDISVDRGRTVRFKINTPASSYRIDIYRLGYYAGMGARLVASVTPSARLPQAQPSCLTDGSTGLIDCGNWSESASWPVPSGATSGIYIAKPVRTDGLAGSSHIPFIVRDDNGAADILFQTSDTTWQAYNQYGGNSLYVGGPGTDPGRAYKVSYNRPFTTRGPTPEDWLFNAEYPMVRWLEANGYNVSYFTGVDADRYGDKMFGHEVYMPVGHDEYYSGGQRAAIEAARDAGVHVAFMIGNGVSWKTRWEPSIDGTATPYRTLVSYKESHARAKIDPADNIWTGMWRDPVVSPPADGGRPENALTGTLFSVNCCVSPALTVPQEYSRNRFWRNTSVAALSPGQVATMTAGTIGYEWDVDADNGFRPAGAIGLSSTTAYAEQRVEGETYGPGNATHRLMLYRAPSGALVFGAGTIQWPWGLDGNHDRGSTTPDTRMRQATVNLLADMGVQPATLQPGLVAAAASSDAAAPVSTITSPAAGSAIAPSSAITIQGSATDTGGVVAGIEVSVDNGLTWHPATGTSSWTYQWTAPSTTAVVTIRSRAVDDSLNLEAPGASAAVNVATAVALDTTITSSPSTPTKSTQATFTFTATRASARFECSLDSTPFSSCSSPAVLTGLTDATHRFDVRAVDGATIDASPASRTWKVDTIAPVISGLTATPSSTSATIAWTTNESSDSRVDYGTSPAALTASATVSTKVTAHTVTLNGLAEGTTYYYGVRSIDAAGNAATAPAPGSNVSFSTRTTTTLNPSAAVLQSGTWRAGSAAQLAADDNLYYEVNSTAATPTSDWYGLFAVPTGAVNLRVTYRGRNSSTATQTIAVWRWTTSSWVQINSASVGLTEVTASNLALAGSPSDYIGPGGEVRVRVRATRFYSFIAYGELMRLSYDR